MKLLLLHQNFPGQYGHIAAWANATKGVEAVAITETRNKRPEVVRTFRYESPVQSKTDLGSPVNRFGEAVSRAESAAKVALALKKRGYSPDLILGHGAWGETWYQREVFPDAKVITYAEFYYRSKGLNRGFDPEFEPNHPDMIRTVDAQNAVMQMSLHTANFGHAPTLFQTSTFPVELQSKIGVVFDGIDTDLIIPDARAQVTLADGTVLKAGEPIVTFINRNLEPHRGYHIFMRAVPRILKDNPKARIVIIGGDGVSYGSAPPSGSWKDIFLNEVRDQIDETRVHYTSRVAHATLRALYQISAAHVYLTYPFVLSWSMLEAMAAQCLIIGSDVAPVRELIEHEKTGLLVPFLDPKTLANTVTKALQSPSSYTHMRKAARAKIVSEYDLKAVCLPKQLAMYQSILDGKGLGAVAGPELLQAWGA